MFEFLGTSTAQAVLWGAALLMLCVLGTYVVLRFRNPPGKDVTAASELLTEFRDLMEAGEINPLEFRKIKEVLGPKLQKEVRAEDTDGTG